ncbi:MAG: nuclear transport factor 2 family protein [Candidatus Koribacter versatilis]|uniref:Nuclear transport factor 2 family protein n=1 Tax=Candidatus Korobacter versatilis TaxID=658062 RepID=A0A932A7G2_9BACT|nr:nuclear transport factor 2 family protein [Candidatus Koribacter versatilis]
MKRLLFVFLLIAALAGAQTSTKKPAAKRATRPAAASAQPPLTETEAVQQLTKRLQEILNAWSTMDPDAAAKFYAKDADLIFFDLAAFQYKGWDDHYLGTKKLFQDYQSLNIRLNEDANVHWKGDLAYATATWNVLGTLADNTQQKLDLRWTVVLERRNGEWVVVHEHVSAPLTDAAAPPSKPAQPQPKKPADPLK